MPAKVSGAPIPRFSRAQAEFGLNFIIRFGPISRLVCAVVLSSTSKIRLRLSPGWSTLTIQFQEGRMRRQRHLVWVLFLVFSLVSATLVFSQEQPNLRNITGIQPGSVLFLSIKGNAAGGSVWGTDIYTLDSSVTAAAVHAGVLANNQTGVVAIIICEGLPAYIGSSRNGVPSGSWGAFGLSFKFISMQQGAVALAGTSQQAQPLPGSSAPIKPIAANANLYVFNDSGVLTRLRKPKAGTVVYVQVNATSAGSVWGTGVYTIDSSLAAASIHAGLLANGQTGILKVTILPGQSSYTGSTQRGITSMSYGGYDLSYSIEPVTQSYQNIVPMIPDPGTVKNIAYVTVGNTYVVWVTGTTKESTIWGTDIYTLDSQLSQAAVHAGILKEGESGPVIVHIVEGQSHYAGSARNGITSAEYGQYSVSYTLEQVR